MSNYSSFSTYVPATEDAATPEDTVRIYHSAGVNSVSVTNGEVTAGQSSSASYDTANLARDSLGDNWRGTARNKNGMPTTTITADSLVTIGGVQGRVSDFVGSGALQETSAGVFEEAPQVASSDTPESAGSAVATMPEDMAGAVDAALEPVPDHAIPALVSAAIGLASGVGDIDTLVSRVVSASGLEPADAKQRTEFAMRAYQSQADSYLTAKAGIAKTDLPAFYESVKSNPRQLQDAIRAQVNGSMAAWGKLASGFQSNVAPSAEALAANGFQTRNTSGTPEVLIGGIWASVKGAARAGLI